MTCKNCGELVRITVRGQSYCWKHYDESLRAQDVRQARYIKVMNDITDEYMKRIFDGPKIVNIN